MCPHFQAPKGLLPNVPLTHSNFQIQGTHDLVNWRPDKLPSISSAIYSKPHPTIIHHPTGPGQFKSISNGYERKQKWYGIFARMVPFMLPSTGIIHACMHVQQGKLYEKLEWIDDDEEPLQPFAQECIVIDSILIGGFPVFHGSPDQGKRQMTFNRTRYIVMNNKADQIEQIEIPTTGGRGAN